MGVAAVGDEIDGPDDQAFALGAVKDGGGKIVVVFQKAQLEVTGRGGSAEVGEEGTALVPQVAMVDRAEGKRRMKVGRANGVRTLDKGLGDGAGGGE